MLKPLLRRNFESDRAFLRLTGETNESSASGYLSQVLAGDKPPPLHKIEAWADALQLTGNRRTEFIDLAAIAHLPESEQLRFEKMRLLALTDANGLKRRIAELESGIDAATLIFNGLRGRSEKSDPPTSSDRAPPEEATHEGLESELEQQIAEDDERHSAGKRDRTG